MATSSESRAATRFHRPRSPAAAGVVLAVAVLVGTSSAFPLVGPAGSSPALGRGSPALGSGRATIAQLGGPVGPFGDRFFTSTNVSPLGPVNSVSGLAVDPATGTVYAANINAGTVTAFGETNGTLLRSAVVANVLTGSFPFALVLDAPNATLYVSVSNRYAGIAGPALPGWVLALDTATLGVRANYSFPTYATPPFEPSFMAYDGPTHQLFVENASGGTVAAVDTVAGSLRTWIDCGVMECADHGYGLLDVPSLHDLVIPTCQPVLVVVNTTRDVVVSSIEGPPTTIMAWSAFDSRSGMLWVENYTFNRSNGTLLKVNLSTNQIVSNIGGVEPRESAMAYDPAADVLVTSDLNGSEQVSTYNASTGVRIASSGGPPGAAHPFKTLAVDPVRGLVLAGGPGNGTTRSFHLPGLAPGVTYASFPASFVGVAIDPGSGRAVLAGSAPNVLWGVNETTGATQFQTALPPGSTPAGLALDPADGRALVADAATGDVLAYDLSNGSSADTLSPLRLGPVAGMLIAADPVHHRLYLAVPVAHEVAVASLPGGGLVGMIPVPGVTPCALAADPPADSAFVANCGGSGNVTQVSAATLGRIGVTGVGPDPSAVTVNGSGTVFVLDNTGTHVAVLNASASGASPAAGWGVTDRRATSLAVDDRDGLLFATGGPSPTVSVYRIGPRALSGELPLSSPSGGVAFDPQGGVVVSAGVYSGGVQEYAVLAAPSAPTALHVLPQNESLSVLWSPPGSAGAGPVTQYVVAVGGGPTVRYSNWSASPASVTGLANGLGYLVRVAATSPFGTGPATGALLAVPAGVPFPPTNLTVALASPTGVTLNWSAPLVDDGATVTGYEVNVTGGPGARLVEVPGATSATVGGLAAGGSYRFEVAARNSAGLGHWSAPATASLPPAPWPTPLLVGVGGGATAFAAIAAFLLARRRRAAGGDVGEAPPDAP